MGDVVNLRQARKRKTRAEAESAAHENRIRHGVPKTQRQSHEREQARADRQLDGHRLKTDPDDAAS